MSKEFEHLFTPFNIGKLTVKNRFAVSAMYLYEAGARGEFTNSAINYYVERAKGGFGLISTGTMLCDTEIDPYNIISDFEALKIISYEQTGLVSIRDREQLRNIAQPALEFNENRD